MKKTMILTSMALMSLVAVGCANEEVKDTQDNQPVVLTNMEEVQTEGNANTKKTLIVYFSYGENSELPQDVDASASATIPVLPVFSSFHFCILALAEASTSCGN